MRRYVLLGASNLTMGLPLMIPSLQRFSAGPCEVLAAAGFGRSYGAWSFFLYRALPGIVDCGLWQHLRERVATEDEAEGPAKAGRSGAIPLFALLTDIGNDILYGFSAEQIAGWVGECAQRLIHYGAETVLILPPLASVRQISRWRFGFFRTIFFPRCRLPFSAVLPTAEELADRLRQLAAEMPLRLFEPPAEWYGFDPIHIRRSLRRKAWNIICSQWSEGYSLSAKPPDVRKDQSLQNRREPADRKLARQIRRASPQMVRRFGRQILTPQPVIRQENLTVALF